MQKCKTEQSKKIHKKQKNKKKDKYCCKIQTTNKEVFCEKKSV